MSVKLLNVATNLALSEKNKEQFALFESLGNVEFSESEYEIKFIIERMFLDLSSDGFKFLYIIYQVQTGGYHDNIVEFRIDSTSRFVDVFRRNIDVSKKYFLPGLENSIKNMKEEKISIELFQSLEYLIINVFNDFDIIICPEEYIKRLEFMNFEFISDKKFDGNVPVGKKILCLIQSDEEICNHVYIKIVDKTKEFYIVLGRNNWYNNVGGKHFLYIINPVNYGKINTDGIFCVFGEDCEVYSELRNYAMNFFPDETIFID